jgi:hypothetical protein
MKTLQKKLRTISPQQMNNCYGGKTIRIFYYDENGQIRFRDIIVN